MVADLIYKIVWNFQLMQVVSQAVFQRLKQPPLLYTATHNRLAYVTSNEITVREIAINPLCSGLRIKGKDIAAISLENPHSLIILYRQGILEVRRIEALNQLVLTANGIMIIDDTLKIRVTLDAVYILCTYYVQKIHFSKEKQREQIFLSQKQNDYAEDMVISSILQQEKILIFQFPNVLSFEIQGIPIARLQFQEINQIKLLRDPLLIGNVQMKEYVLVIEQRRWLKVYDVVSLQQILEMELFLEGNEGMEMKIDPLHEYVMLRVYDVQTDRTIRNSLLKVNKEYYIRQSKEPFFLFDIQLGLKEDLILFPTHLQVINGSQFHSIDMCFFTNQYIKIATLVVDINHRTRLYHTHHMDPNWAPIEHWNEIISNLKSQEPEERPKKQKNTPEISYKNETDRQWNRFIKQFWQQNLEKFQSEGLVFNFDRSYEQPQKYLEYPHKYPIKDNTEMQDALNTLSGSSSFRSSGQAGYNQELLLKMIEGVDFSIQSQKKEDLSVELQEPDIREDSEISDDDEYLMKVAEGFNEIFVPMNSTLDTFQDKIGRVQDVHVKKLKRIERSIRNHRKQTDKLAENIPKWCDEYMNNFASQIKNSLNQFNATVTRLEIMGNRRVKKLKKGFRDFLDEQIESREEKLEQSEHSMTKNVDHLMKELGMK